jgi:hypothetical protein
LDGGKHPSKRKRFSIDFNWYQVVKFVNFVQIMLALIVLSSITKKGEIVTNMAPLMPLPSSPCLHLPPLPPCARPMAAPYGAGATWPPTRRSLTQTALERHLSCRNQAPLSLAEVATRPHPSCACHDAMAGHRCPPGRVAPVPHSPSSALPPR